SPNPKPRPERGSSLAEPLDTPPGGLFVQKLLVESEGRMSQRRDDFFLIAFSERTAMALRYAIAAKKVASSIDKHVGSRVRMRRIMLAMSQEHLADALRVTYQQVQKNEKGANRIGASRLQQLSEILQVPVAFFFEGAPNALAPHDSNESALSIAEIDDFVSGSNGLRLMRAFMRIDNADLRRRIVMLVQEIAGDDDPLGTPPGGL